MGGEGCIRLRNATAADLPGVMRVEQEWPAEQRATEDKFRSRLARFPQGFFVAVGDGHIIGVSTSCLVRYDPERLAGFTSWDGVTNGGHLPPVGSVAEPNALYIVSTGVLRAYRGQRVAPALITRQIALAEQLGLEYCVSAAVLPGYDAHCRARGDTDAAEYVFLRERDRLVDPLLRMLAELGLLVPDRRHVVASYYPDPDSRDYSAIVVRRSAGHRAS